MASSSSAAPSHPQLVNADSALFKPVVFAISPSIKPTIRAALHDILVTASARPCPPSWNYSSNDPTSSRFDLSQLTHFISDSLDFPEYPLLRPEGDDGGNGKGKGREGGVQKDVNKVEIVSPAWVTRSYDLQALQPPRFYSASRAKIFSGTVVCTSDFPEPDNLAVAGAVEAFGGQFRRELTREVTHLICVADQGTKYEMAMKFGSELGMVVVLPYWFEESLKLAQLLPVDIYRFPSPPFTHGLRDGSSTKPFANRLHSYWQTRLSSGATSSSSSASTVTPISTANTATSVILGGVSPSLCSAPDTDTYLRQTSELEGPSSAFRSIPAEGRPLSTSSSSTSTSAHPVAPQPSRASSAIFAQKKVYLASDLGLSASLERALKGAIEAAGGECWSFGVDGDSEAAAQVNGGAARGGEKAVGGKRTDAFAKRRVAERNLKECGLVIMRTREGWEYWTAYDLSLPLGNLAYLYHCLSTSSLPSPLSRLLHYPLPSLDGVPALRGKVVTVSNYAGPARDYVRAMIEVLGAKFEGTMGRGTDYVVSASEYGSKVSHARTWSIPLVTHLWLEACLQSWSLVSPVLHPSYTLSSATACETHFTTILGGSGWTTEGLREWAEREEVRGLREMAKRGVEELEREAEEEMRREAEEAKLAGGGEGEDDDAGLDDYELEIEVEGEGEGKNGAAAVAAPARAAVQQPEAEEEEEEDAEMLPPPVLPPSKALPKPRREERAQSTLVVGDTFVEPVRANGKEDVAPTVKEKKDKKEKREKKEKGRREESAPTATEVDGDDNEAALEEADRPVSKSKKAKRSTSPPPPKKKKKKAVTPAADSDNDDEAPVQAVAVPPPPPPARLPSPKPATVTPAKPAKDASKKKKEKKAAAAASKPTTKRERSSSLSSHHSDSSTSSQSTSDFPASANRLSKTFNQISNENLVVAGTKRGAAAKAAAKVAVAMADRNRFEQEQRSSAVKGKKRASTASGLGGGASQGRSQSPTKRGKRGRSGTGSGTEAEREDDDDDEEEEEEKEPTPPPAPVKKAKKRVAKEDEGEDAPAPPAKKKKAEHKALKTVQASAGGAGTTQEGGAVSSFDNPPKAKPVVSKSNKIRIISTGLGLDKASTEIKSLKSLGASWTDKPQEATHLVVKGISRTEKFLCCLPYAPKIVTKSWLDACVAAGRIVDEAPYLLHDEPKEKEIGDTLAAILARAKKGKLFNGRNVYITGAVVPDQATMSRIVQACGGIVITKPLTKLHKKIGDDEDSLVISCATDRREWDKLAAAPIKKEIYAVEAVFVAVLHQDLKRGFTGSNRVDAQLNE